MGARWRSGAVLAAVLAAGGCGGGGTGDALASVPPMPVTTDVFLRDVLHRVELTVAEADLPVLVPFGEERVRARLVYDGVALDDVGLRLKGGLGSARPLTDKASFALKTNHFVPGQRLHGVKRFTLDSEVQDPSLLAAHLGYDVFLAAGLPARRSALARVTFNGAYFGVYLVAEQIDGDFVSRWFPGEDEGNLYEGEHTDVTVPEALELETNEDEDDRADVEALAALLLEGDDLAFTTTVGTLVDLDAFHLHWAVEALLDHWDGYVGMNLPTGVGAPNNYYVYHHPARGFLWVSHGIDQVLGRVDVPVLGAPSAPAVLPTRLLARPGGRARVAAAVREVLATAWDPAALTARVDLLEPLLERSVVEATRAGNPGLGPWRGALGHLRAFFAARGPAVVAELEAEGL